MRRLLVTTAMMAALIPVAGASAAERTLTYRAGPYVAGAFETIRPKVIVRSPPRDGFITRMHARLVDAKGRPVLVRQVMLHHVLFINRGHRGAYRTPKCGTRFGEPFYGTGEEDETLLLPPGYGYPTRRGDKWKMQTMLMSHQPRAQRVWMEYTMTVVEGEAREPVTPYWVRATRCRNEPSFNVPGGGAPGSVFRKENTWVPPEDGRIVAAGSHLHGGAHDIELLQRNCSGRRLLRSRPFYGMPGDVMYDVKPLLHEPGPSHTTWFLSGQGVPIAKGEPIRVVSNYDATRPHVGAMGVMHVYVARGRGTTERCPPGPTDVVEVGPSRPARAAPPAVTVPLTVLEDGVPTTLPSPPGRLWFFDNARERPVIGVDGGIFRKRNISVARGTTLTWRFDDPVPHKVSLANGPRAMGSPTLTGGRRWSWRMEAPGTYQLFCYLHPMTMHQEVQVRP